MDFKEIRDSLLQIIFFFLFISAVIPFTYSKWLVKIFQSKMFLT